LLGPLARTSLGPVTKSTFSLAVHELDDGPKELSGPLPLEWMRQILKDTDVQPHEQADGQLELTLTKTGLQILVQGRLNATIVTPCARTLDPAIYTINPDIFLLLEPANQATAEAAASGGRRRRPRDQAEKSSAKGKGGWDADPELSDTEAASDTYSGDKIELDSFLREFILLEVPMVPLREDLRGAPFEANPPLPTGRDTADASSEAGSAGTSEEKPLDPRLSPLAEIKARLENKE